MAEIAPKVAQK